MTVMGECLMSGVVLLLSMAPMAAQRKAAQGTAPEGKQENQDVMLAEGEGRDLVVAKCTVCHDAARIRSTYRDEQAWVDLVDNMISRGASVTPDEAHEIVAYLFEHYGIH